MKILELRFKNLNSLYGEWSIDLTSPEYLADGIFAITGPTGAGKSTILDAICLALYGTTPRLGKITKSGNEIMSRQTGECYAEVTFAASAGKFRCHWSQHRAHKKAGGNLADAKHEIADATSGKILESKKRDVATVIEKKTGMNFERFTRSILLAQGGFDTFLKADSDRRAPILEQITGSEIYSEISIRVHERQRDEREQLNLLQAETSGITLLTKEQEAETNLELTEKQITATKTATQVQEIEKALAWHTGIDKLRQEIISLSQEAEKLSTTLKAFTPQREKLDRAQKAAEFEGAYANLGSTRKQQNDDQQAIQKEATQLPEATDSVAQKEALLKDSEKLTLAVKNRQKSITPLLQKVRTLDQQLADREKTISKEEIEAKKIEQKIAADQKFQKQIKSRFLTAQKDARIIENYLQSNTGDESLVTQLAGIEEQFNNLISKQQNISAGKVSLIEAEKQLQSAIKEFSRHSRKAASHTQELNDTQRQVGDKKTNLNTLLGKHLLREYRTEKETRLREMAFFKKIADLKSAREKLEDGHPCPLCGAEKHPYAEGNVPEADETEKRINALSDLIDRAERLESEIKTLEETEKKLSVKVTTTARLEAEAANKKQVAEKSLSDLTGDLSKDKKEFTHLKQASLTRLRPLGIKEIPDSDLGGLLTPLRTRRKLWQEQQQKREKIEQQLAELNGNLKEINAIIAIQAQSLAGQQEGLGTLKDEYAILAAERTQLFGNKIPHLEETRLRESVDAAESAEKTLRSKCDAVKQELHAIKIRITSLKEQISKRVPELQTLETGFINSLKIANFADEQSFIANRLTAAKREQLINRAKELDDQKTDLRARRKDRENRLTVEIDKKITETTAAELKPSGRELSETLKQVREHISVLQHKLSDNNSAKEKIREKQALIDARKSECRRWEKLHALIGSADGKKYRNFAQGLTFELMVAHANRQLGKMTDRYLLIRDTEQPLELNVIDNYQAGEIRSTKNLSGGESFIVSLALALGLAKMASRKVRVDSLFLDEGFGSLDEEALETALETLASLQQHNKLIGIISHVPALKERISAQINILPESGGKSSITGPGCKNI